ncbi:hypothetical protein MVES1_000545 [Malassezia vespertilionis]|uniref:uncharacterized protein n=1 Tax=Malassezia vespertilionis TaxID=2020962 RepID=UPI0024B1485B|nr:uncharacterized protein MVES1_000545 [Malassezia vespertilionis]WFD05217.1 hypothetical protein MVES1_000545 [Malassezia vespertilionis]
MATKRHSTAWDVAALRWSTLSAHDAAPKPGKLGICRGMYGSRYLPAHLGCASDLGLGVFLSSSEEGGESAPVGAPASETSMHAMVLRNDAFSSDDICADTQRVREQRIVAGALERQSPYWEVQRQTQRGPMQARFALVGRDMERFTAASQRSTSLRTDRGTKRRAMALVARKELGNTDAEAEHSCHSPSPTPEYPGDLTHILPRLVRWSERDESLYKHGEYGWVFDPLDDVRMPSTDLCMALQYYAAQFYQARHVLQPESSFARKDERDKSVCAAIRARCMDQYGFPCTMAPGEPLWDYWIAISVGQGRPMLQALDGSALVALCTFMEEYASRAMPPPIRDSAPDDAFLGAALAEEHTRNRPRTIHQRTPASIMAQWDEDTRNVPM